MLALWNVADTDLAALPLAAWGVDVAVGSIDTLVAEVAVRLDHVGAMAWTPAAFGAKDAERVRALRDSGVLDASLRGTFDSAARRAADIFDVPLAMITLIDEQWQYTHGDSARTERPAVGEPQRGLERTASMCGHVVANGAAMVVPDVHRDLRFAGNPALIENAIRFYAGAPLRDAEGNLLGTLCLLDTQPRTLSRRDAKLLESLADDSMAPLHDRVPPAVKPLGADEQPEAVSAVSRRTVPKTNPAVRSAEATPMSRRAAPRRIPQRAARHRAPVPN